MRFVESFSLIDGIEMHRLIVMVLIIFLALHEIRGVDQCICICCRGDSCAPVVQPAFTVPSCDSDNKCNGPCCQRYPDVCFPLPGPGVVDSTCQNSTVITQ